MDDGELFLEYSQSESVALDDGRIKSAAFDTTQGFGLRAVAGEAAGYAHASELSEAAIRRAGDDGARGRERPSRHARRRRRPAPTAASTPTSTRSALVDLGGQDAGSSPRSTPMPAAATRACARSWPRSAASGRRCRSSAPTAAASPTSARWCGSTSRSWSATATAWKPARTAPAGASPTSAISTRRNWKAQVDEALRQALVNLGSVPAPAGEMTVVLGPGWPGVMLHEAVGHGLEGDFNRKKTSAFSGHDRRSASRPRASPSSTTARCPTGAAR